VNPSPGFSFYEHGTGQPISAALADLLHRSSSCDPAAARNHSNLDEPRFAQNYAGFSAERSVFGDERHCEKIAGTRWECQNFLQAKQKRYSRIRGLMEEVAWPDDGRRPNRCGLQFAPATTPRKGSYERPNWEIVGGGV
jgi:hypothetical protein